MEAFPLHWPVGYPRTERPKRSNFRDAATFDAARKGVVAEIKRLGGRDIIISTNLPLRLDGYPHASAKMPQDRGVAVYFSYKNNPVVFACDRWDLIAHNMRAIEKSIEAMRGLERWGASDMIDRAFTGFQALPESSTTNKSAHQILGISINATPEEIKKAYRGLMMKHHPDTGDGNREAWEKFKSHTVNFYKSEPYHDNIRNKKHTPCRSGFGVPENKRTRE